MITAGREDNSYLHRLDIRTKLIVFLCLIVMVFLFNSPLFNLATAVVLLGAVLPSGLNIKRILVTIKPLIAIFVIIIVMTCFTSQPEKFVNDSSRFVLFYLLPDQRIPATLGGLYIGLTFLLRIFIMVFATAVFTITTPIDDILQLFSKMKAPYELSIVVTTAISFVPTMTAKKDLIFQAQKARGAGISKKGVINQLKAYIPIMIPLITNSILMANNLAISMMNRGYGANKTWTSLHDIEMHGRDFVVMICAVLLLGVCIWMRYGLTWGVV
jgi:energy-coupling factor transport system permease protein